jgi:isoaspartyl peptidase/L-asparaginase-like protein (Ntn-hydrolase superfamily)
VLAKGEPALEAAIIGTVVMENLPHFNAGTGANIRLDGKTKRGGFRCRRSH